jgi:hypothetical protein
MMYLADLKEYDNPNWFFVATYTSTFDMTAIFEADNTEGSVDFAIVEEVTTGMV